MLRRVRERQQRVARPGGRGLQARVVHHARHVPEAEQPHGDFDVAGVGRPRERGPQVVSLSGEPVLPGDAVRTGDAGDQGVREVGEVAGMRGPEPLAVAARVEVILRVLADRLEEPVAGLGRLRVGHDERSCDERGEELEHVVRLDDVARPDGFGRLEAEAAREHAEPLQQQLLARVEQVVRPVDRGAQRLVALDRGARPTAEQPEPLVEPAGDVGRA